MKKINIYLIDFHGSIFEHDIYYSKKIKSLGECEIKLDAVFAKDFKFLPIVDKYCSNHNIETINLEKNLQNYFLEVIRYNVNNPDKRNLVVLISEKISSKLNSLFKQDPCFNPHII